MDTVDSVDAVVIVTPGSGTDLDSAVRAYRKNPTPLNAVTLTAAAGGAPAIIFGDIVLVRTNTKGGDRYCSYPTRRDE